jgi:hypothetical protein
MKPKKVVKENSSKKHEANEPKAKKVQEKKKGIKS